MTNSVNINTMKRTMIILAMVLAFLGAASMAAPREAQAAGYGTDWYLTTHDGRQYQCWWIYHGTDSYGNHVWTEDGCIIYYGGQQYYKSLISGAHYVWQNNQWISLTSFWSTSVVGGLADSSAGTYHLMNQIAAATGEVAWGSSSSSRTSSSLTTSRSETPRQLPGAPTGSGSLQTMEAAPEQEESPTMRASSTEFPRKVCQDDGNCFRYSGTAWKKVNTSKAMGGSYRVSSSKSHGAFFAATGPTDAGGSTMKLITNTGPTMGKAKVLVVNLGTAKVVKTAYFDLSTSERRYKVAKSITGLTPHQPYGLVVLSANGRPVAVDSVGYEAHGNMCHNVL